MVGVRDISADTELTVTSDDPVSFVYKSDPSATDTLIMLRPSFRISENWRFNPTMSYAVAGDSDTHYELSPQFQYQFSDSLHCGSDTGLCVTNSKKVRRTARAATTEVSTPISAV